MKLAGLMAVGVLCGRMAVSAAEPLVAHEWGTFTSLQDADGTTIGGINTDEESLPSFVHDLLPGVIGDSRQAVKFPSKGGPISPVHPSVTLRLETPVVYFYLPKDQKSLGVDVEVGFHGGWLSQFYPKAEVVAPEAKPGAALKPDSRSTLTWKGLTVGGKGVGPATDSSIWLSPRVEKADSVRTMEGEMERFLFYRGLGHVDSPLQTRQVNGNLLLNWREANSVGGSVWLLDTRSDGSSAFRSGSGPSLRMGFAKDEYRKNQLSKLREELQSALVAAGLYPEEASAMLKTWEASYFQSPGTRVFFLVPSTWVDTRLPLKVSVPAKVTRVMIGRVELSTAADAKRLRELAAGSYEQAFTPEQVPAAYRDLGRFRQALVRHELRVRPTKGLEQFVELNGL